MIGEKLYFAGIGMDITEQRRMTRALEEQVQGQGALEVENGRQHGWLGMHDAAFVQHYRQIARHRQAGIQRQLHDTCQRAFRLDAARRLSGKEPT